MKTINVCLICHHNFAVISGKCRDCHAAITRHFATVLRASDLYAVVDNRGGEGVFLVFDSAEESWEEEAGRFDIIHDLVAGLHYCRSKLDGRCTRIEEPQQ
jgi:hypothetical protein